MMREFCFNLTVPLADLEAVTGLLDEARRDCPPLRISRKPDRHDCARFYLSFPFTDSRPDLSFQQWFTPLMRPGWDLFGPNPGRWGLI